MASAAPRRTRYEVADTLSEPSAAALVRQALAGSRPLPDRPEGLAPTLLWDDHGDQALVHADSVVVRFVKRFAFVSVDLETEQTGRAALIVTLAATHADLGHVQTPERRGISDTSPPEVVPTLSIATLYEIHRVR